MLDWQHRVTYSFVKRQRQTKDREQRQSQKQRTKTETKTVNIGFVEIVTGEIIKTEIKS